MNSDVLALCLSVVLVLIKTIDNLLNGTLTGYQLSLTLFFSLLFWFTARHVCDVLTWKVYIRRWSEEGFKMIYVFRDQRPFGYIMCFVFYLFASVWTALVVLYGSGKG